MFLANKLRADRVVVIFCPFALEMGCTGRGAPADARAVEGHRGPAPVDAMPAELASLAKMKQVSVEVGKIWVPLGGDNVRVTTSGRLGSRRADALSPWQRRGLGKAQGSRRLRKLGYSSPSGLCRKAAPYAERRLALRHLAPSARLATILGSALGWAYSRPFGADCAARAGRPAPRGTTYAIGSANRDSLFATLARRSTPSPTTDPGPRSRLARPRFHSSAESRRDESPHPTAVPGAMRCASSRPDVRSASAIARGSPPESP